MSRVRKTVPEWAKEVAEQITLWQIMCFCYMLWAKIQELFPTIQPPVEEYDEFFDSFASLSLDDTNTIPRVGCTTLSISKNSGLLPLIPDPVTMTTFWKKLRSPSILLLDCL